MAFNNCRRAVQLTNQAIVAQLTLLRAKAHCAAQIALLCTDFDVAVFIAPFGNQGHHRVLTVWHKFRGVGVVHTHYVTCKLNQRNLHTQANAQIRNIVLTRKTRRRDFTFNTAVAEAARDQDCIKTFQDLNATRFDILRIDQLDVDGDTILQTTVLQRFDN